MLDLRKSGDAAAPGATPQREDETRVREERAIVCRDCAHAITRASARIEVDGAHRHTFVNPSAIEFVIGCFKEAPGCLGWGEESTFWSWFPGRSWRIALCARCAAHLGWSFGARDATSSAFFGLILDRLVEV